MMVIESAAILIMLAVLIFLIARSGRRTFALALLPLLIVPAAYLVSVPASQLLSAILPLGRLPLAIGVTLAGLVVACVLFGMLCGNFPTRRYRRGYLFMCGGFSAVLTVVLLWNMMVAIRG